MSRILFVKANDRPAKHAISVQMYDAFLKRYKETHPYDDIAELDLFQAELPYYGDKVIAGLYKMNEGKTPSPEEQKAAELANRYVDHFLSFDKMVIAFPMWNFTIPAPLLTYISYLTQSGKTFIDTADGPIGLAADKKVALLTARGGDYSQLEMKHLEMSLHYVKVAISLFGIHTPDTVVIEGHNQYPGKRETLISEGLQKTADLAARF